VWELYLLFPQVPAWRVAGSFFTFQFGNVTKHNVGLLECSCNLHVKILWDNSSHIWLPSIHSVLGKDPLLPSLLILHQFLLMTFKPSNLSHETYEYMSYLTSALNIRKTVT
jgi:hypothetical protein